MSLIVVIKKNQCIFRLLLFVVCVFLKVGAEDLQVAPVNIQAAMFIKLLAFDKNLNGSIVVWVIGEDGFAVELKKGVGKEVGAATLGDVKSGAGLPADKPQVIYVNDSKLIADVIAYTRANKILTITGNPELVAKGVTLGIGVSEGKPKILLNISSSKEEEIDWNPAILKIALTVK
ncbi:MAG: YfiR family protein [Chitinivibrionales bacterium]|nr:YfiR family protein [Chitinivibrionales bacterium]